MTKIDRYEKQFAQTFHQVELLEHLVPLMVRATEPSLEKLAGFVCFLFKTDQQVYKDSLLQFWMAVCRCYPIHAQDVLIQYLQTNGIFTNEAIFRRSIMLNKLRDRIAIESITLPHATVAQLRFNSLYPSQVMNETAMTPEFVNGILETCGVQGVKTLIERLSKAPLAERQRLRECFENSSIFSSKENVEAILQCMVHDPMQVKWPIFKELMNPYAYQWVQEEHLLALLMLIDQPIQLARLSDKALFDGIEHLLTGKYHRSITLYLNLKYLCQLMIIQNRSVDRFTNLLSHIVYTWDISDKIGKAETFLSKQMIFSSYIKKIADELSKGRDQWIDEELCMIMAPEQIDPIMKAYPLWPDQNPFVDVDDALFERYKNYAREHFDLLNAQLNADNWCMNIYALLEADFYNKVQQCLLEIADLKEPAVYLDSNPIEGISTNLLKKFIQKAEEYLKILMSDPTTLEKTRREILCTTLLHGDYDHQMQEALNFLFQKEQKEDEDRLQLERQLKTEEQIHEMYIRLQTSYLQDPTLTSLRSEGRAWYEYSLQSPQHFYEMLRQNARNEEDLNSIEINLSLVARHPFDLKQYVEKVADIPLTEDTPVSIHHWIKSLQQLNQTLSSPDFYLAEHYVLGLTIYVKLCIFTAEYVDNINADSYALFSQRIQEIILQIPPEWLTLEVAKTLSECYKQCEPLWQISQVSPYREEALEVESIVIMPSQMPNEELKLYTPPRVVSNQSFFTASTTTSEFGLTPERPESNDHPKFR